MTIEKSNEPQAFADFEHAGWEAVSDGYARHFAPLTRQAVEPTLDAAGVAVGMAVLDACCGPGVIASAALAITPGPQQASSSAVPPVTPAASRVGSTACRVNGTKCFA